MGKTAAYSGLGSLLGLKGKVESDIGKTGVVLFYLLLVCICVCVYVHKRVCACMWEAYATAEVRRQLGRLSSLYPPLCGFGGSNSGGQAAWPVALPAELAPGYLF